MAELDQPKANETAGIDLPNLQAMRDRILSDLKLGKQASGYKAAVKALDRLIALLPPAIVRR
jgi:hypothetical protein